MRKIIFTICGLIIVGLIAILLLDGPSSPFNHNPSEVQQ